VLHAASFFIERHEVGLVVSVEPWASATSGCLGSRADERRTDAPSLLPPAAPNIASCLAPDADRETRRWIAGQAAGPGTGEPGPDGQVSRE
jgi:hypothetical protein